jgi:selenophosphate synthetase-related protein
MNRKYIIAMLALALVFFTVGWKYQSKPAQWEYTFITNQKKLNEMGAQGWELVSAVDQISGGSSIGTFYYLKRPK